MFSVTAPSARNDEIAGNASRTAKCGVRRSAFVALSVKFVPIFTSGRITVLVGTSRSMSAGPSTAAAS